MMKNRKHLWIVSFLLALFACAVFAACNTNDGPTGGDEPAAVETISISNESALTAEWIIGSADRTVHVTFTPETLTEENTQFTVESSDTDVVTVNGKSIKAVGKGTSTITVKAGDATDSVNVTVSIGNPTIEVAGDTGAIEGIAKSVQNLVLAEACDGTDLADSVELTFDDTDNITYDEEKGTVTFAEVGEYELTFTVADPRDAAKTASVTVVANVARNPITTSNVDFSYSNMYGDESAQTVSTSSGELAYAYYNTTASKLYYAEATFDIGSPHQGVQVGLGHFIPGNTNRMVGMGVDRGDRNFKIKDIDWIKTPNPNFDEGWSENGGLPYADANYALFNYRLVEYRGLTDDDASHVKFAVARVGDMMYAFVNDQYVASVVFDYYRNVDTVPGIIGTMWSTTQVSGMSWLSGKDAQTKIDSLLETGLIQAYAPEGWASGSVENFDTCVADIGRDENGYKFKYTSDDTAGVNDSMVSPYIYFEGDFTFEWIYKYKSGTGRAFLEVREWRYANKPILNLGERHSDNLFLLDRQPETDDPLVPENKWDQPSFTDTSKWGGSEFDFSQGTKYTLTRVLSDTEATYTLTVTSVANPSQTYSRTIRYSENKWSEPVFFHWKNQNVAGEYSGIKWEAFDADALTDPRTVSITNKSALAADWILGEAPRTVEIAFTPDNFTVDNYTKYTITSSNPDAVTVSGRTLTAVGVGKTTITVTVPLDSGDLTDSVDIIVMDSVPTGIEISNESELTAAWAVGDADRTVHVTFTPGNFTEDNASFTVESSDPEVIRADGKKLVAVSAGTATITVKVGDATDTVEITVSLADPTITAEDQIDVVYDKTYNVSDLVTAESCDGLDLSDNIAVTFEDDGIAYDAEKGTLSFDNTKSAYTVTFTVTDSRGEGLTATKTVTFNVYRNPLGTSNYEFTLSNIADGDESAQTATIDRDNLAYAYYNTTASKLYYAEATFDIEMPHGGVQVGLGHFIPDDTTRMIGMGVDRGDRNFKIKDIDWVKTPNPDFQEGDPWNTENGAPYAEANYALYNYRLVEYRGFTDENAGHVKFAVARDGNFFYAFINDQYIASVSFDYYLDKDTVPGIIGTMWTTTSISGMSWLSGEDAQTKIDSLIGAGQMIKPYSPDSWATNSVTNFDDVTSIGADESGLKFNYTSTENAFNDSMVSPYIYFEKDFTFSWVYKNTGASGSEARMILEVRDWRFGNEIVQFGGDYTSTGNFRFLLNVSQKKDWYEGQNGFDDSQGARFTITRTLHDTYAEYTMTATSEANPEQTLSRSIQWSEIRWDEPVIFLWHNTYCAGEYSQITWSVPDKTASAG